MIGVRHALCGCTILFCGTPNLWEPMITAEPGWRLRFNASLSELCEFSSSPSLNGEPAAMVGRTDNIFCPLLQEVCGFDAGGSAIDLSWQRGGRFSSQFGGDTCHVPTEPEDRTLHLQFPTRSLLCLRIGWKGTTSWRRGGWNPFGFSGHVPTEPVEASSAPADRHTCWPEVLHASSHDLRTGWKSSTSWRRGGWNPFGSSGHVPTEPVEASSAFADRHTCWQEVLHASTHDPGRWKLPSALIDVFPPFFAWWPVKYTFPEWL